ncbi:hypothetical protein QO002_001829 [Pararhizobium capsulatum DSM 1112]|uniref:Uncharacterized protein n=1 Tax=Pararhizobium capsulatum DSM 1112 TaxID=1121113 RepID=A0ABU0BN59_9HYPH|nr:hypothetical protein [Pararhizobium capsulatum]MDQ0319691.1 hypothetical protein [Pararhizobium capsulatum DSM 1112]
MTVLVAGNGLASTFELDVAVNKATWVSKDPPVQRKAIAQASLAYWKNFYGRIPNNSPIDDEWLANEMNSKDTERMTRAINSSQYSLDQLRKLGKYCVDVYKSIEQSVGNNKQFELYLWLKAVHCYSGASNTLADLENAGLSNGRYDGPFHMIHFGIVLPHITGDLADALESE